MSNRIILQTFALLLFSSLFAHAQTSQSVIAAFAKSYEQEQDGDYAAAIKTMKAVYASDSYELNLRLGWLHFYSQLYQESVGYYKKAIAQKSNSVEARFGYVMPAAALENWTDVINQYNAILSIDPANSIAHYRLAYIYYYREDFTKAETYLKKVTNMYPFDYDSIILLAWNQLKQGKESEAKKYFNRSLMISPENSSALEGLKLLN